MSSVVGFIFDYGFYVVVGGMIGLYLVPYVREQWRKFRAAPSVVPQGGSNGLLDANNIPRPELLMVNLLALKIAAMPGDSYVGSRVWIKLSAGSRVEINFELDDGYRDSFDSASVYVYDAAGAQRSVKLTEAEKAILLKPLRALVYRYRVRRAEQEAQQSSEASLDVLTEMFSPIEDEKPPVTA